MIVNVRAPIFIIFIFIGSVATGQNICLYNEFSSVEKNNSINLNSENPTRLLEATDTFDVVFHIIHTGDTPGTGSNISDEQIESAVLSLNRDFGAWPIHDSISIRPNGVDTKFFFRLACQDPQGMPTNGIKRVDGRVVPGYTENGFVFKQGNTGNNNDLVALSRWPDDRYINIWVTHRIMTPFSGLTFGGGFGPGSVIFNAGGGGLYLNYRVVGCDPYGTNGYLLTNRYGKIISHEMGHYLGLLHTFEGESCNEVNCNIEGDRVCDTEPHTNSKSNDPSCNETIECNSREPIENLMNYSGPECGNIFTAGQKARMKAFTAQFLADVTNQPACIQTVVAEVNNSLKNLTVFPNPASGLTIIQIPGTGWMQIFSSDGRLQKEIIVETSQLTLELSNLPKGLLLLRCMNEHGIQTTTLIHR